MPNIEYTIAGDFQSKQAAIQYKDTEARRAFGKSTPLGVRQTPGSNRWEVYGVDKIRHRKGPRPDLAEVQAKHDELTKKNKEITKAVQAGDNQREAQLRAERTEISNRRIQTVSRARAQGDAQTSTSLKTDIISNLLRKQGKAIEVEGEQVTARYYQGTQGRKTVIDARTGVYADVPSTAQVLTQNIIIEKKRQARRQATPTKRKEFVESILEKQGYGVSTNQDIVTAVMPGSTRKTVIDVGRADAVIYKVPQSADVQRAPLDKIGTGKPKWYATGPINKAYLAYKNLSRRKANKEFNERIKTVDTSLVSVDLPGMVSSSFRSKFKKSDSRAMGGSDGVFNDSRAPSFLVGEKGKAKRFILGDEKGGGLAVIPRFLGSAAKGALKLTYAPNYGGKKPIIDLGQEKYLRTQSLIKDRDIQNLVIIGAFSSLPATAGKIVYGGVLAASAYSLGKSPSASKAGEVAGLAGFPFAVKAVSAAKGTPGKVRAILARRRAVDKILADVGVRPYKPKPGVESRVVIQKSIFRRKAPPGIERLSNRLLDVGAPKKGITFARQRTTGASFKGIQKIAPPEPKTLTKKGNIIFKQLGIQEAKILKPSAPRKKLLKLEILPQNYVEIKTYAQSPKLTQFEKVSTVKKFGTIQTVNKVRVRKAGDLKFQYKRVKTTENVIGGTQSTFSYSEGVVRKGFAQYRLTSINIGRQSYGTLTKQTFLDYVLPQKRIYFNKTPQGLIKFREVGRFGNVGATYTTQYMPDFIRLGRPRTTIKTRKTARTSFDVGGKYQDVPYYNLRTISKTGRYRVVGKSKQFKGGRDIEKAFFGRANVKLRQTDRSGYQVVTTKYGQRVIKEVYPSTIKYAQHPTYKPNVKRYSMENLVPVSKITQRPPLYTRRETGFTLKQRYAYRESRYKPVKAFIESTRAMGKRGSVDFRFRKRSFPVYAQNPPVYFPAQKASPVLTGKTAFALLGKLKAKPFFIFGLSEKTENVPSSLTRSRTNTYVRPRVQQRPSLSYRFVPAVVPTVRVRALTRTQTRTQTRTRTQTIVNVPTPTPGGFGGRGPPIPIIAGPPGTPPPLRREELDIFGKKSRRVGFRYFYREFRLIGF